MKKVVLTICSIVFASFLHSQVIQIPADYPTIQQGIDAASIGDTILVSPGTYPDPITFLGKNITVASLYLTTQDPAYISQTTIGQVLLENGEDSTAVLTGFTITNPITGSGIICGYGSPTLRRLVITGNHFEEGYGRGGGISCYYESSPYLEDLIITGNSALYGGGISCYYASPTLKNVTVCNNHAEMGGGFYFYYECNPVFSDTERCSVYSNSANMGNDLYGDSYDWSVVTITMPLDTFSVLYPNDYYVDHGHELSFVLDIQHGIIPQLDANLYVSPTGDNNNTGLTASSPFKTLLYAFSRIRADYDNQNTIYLLAGTYSTSITGEVFPVNVIDYVNLAGSSQNTVTLDAEGQQGVLQFKHNESNILTQVTVTGAMGCGNSGILCDHASPSIQYVTVTGNENTNCGGGTDGNGGGITCITAGPVLDHVTLSGNKAGSGGGMYVDFESSPALNHVSIMNNESTGKSYSGWGYYYAGGGGLFSQGPDLWMEDVVVNGNTAIEGGGIHLAGYFSGWGVSYYTNAHMKGVSIYNNYAESGGGITFSGQCGITFDSIDRCSIYLNNADEGSDLFTGLSLNTTTLHIAVDTFSVLYPSEYYAESLSKLTFNIDHGMLSQVDADLYISPLGSNTNSGLNAAEPLKTLRHAFSLIRADSLQQHTIHLLPGTYGTSYTGESMPVNVIDYVNLAGAAQEQVILDAEGGSRVMKISGNGSNELSGMTLTGGEVMYASGGGLLVEYSSPHLSHMIIRDNTCQEGSGGGICCWYSEPVFSYLTLFGNETEGIYWSGGEGGAIYLGWSPSLLDHVLIEENTSSSGGGGIYFNSSAGTLLESTIKDNISAGQGGGMILSSLSDLQMENVLVKGNNASNGGGMVVSYASPELKGVTFSDNKASGKGGAIFFEGYAYPVFDSVNRCNLFSDEAFSGNDLYSTCPDILQIRVDTFSVLEPTDLYAKPIDRFTFDILHGKLNQADADVYVSSYSGDDNNSGLTPGDPFRTIRHACRVITGDSLDPHTIRLIANEAYTANNGEYFPVSLPSYVSLAGENNELHASGQPYTVYFEDNKRSNLSGLEIRGGSDAGMLIYHSDPVLENIQVSYNQGYGLKMQASSKPVIKNSSINYNGHSGIYCLSSMPVIRQSTIKGNQNMGIWSESSQPDLLDVTITENQGTGYYAYDYSYYGTNEAGSLENVILSKNSSDQGGGMLLNGSFPVMRNVRVIENFANRGGGVFVANDYGSRKMNNLYISGNTALEGGGVYVTGYGGVIRLCNLVLDHNIAQFGGGVFIAPESRPTLSNLTCVDNLSNHGGGIYTHDTKPVLMNNSILWNNYPQSLYIDSSYFRITNSDVEGGESGIISVNHSTVVWYVNNLEEDPLLVGSGDDPYALSAGSPCIDAGLFSSSYGIPELDIVGNPRVWDGDGNGYAVIDMGAYEYGSMVVGVEEQSAVNSQQEAVSCYPNPFQSQLTIEYKLDQPGQVRIVLYDQMGQEAATLINESQSEGLHRLYPDTENLPTGIYYCHLQAGDRVVTMKIVKVR